MQRSPVLFRRKRRILRIRGLLLAVARGNCCSHRFNRAGLWLRWYCFPTRISKPHTALHRASCGFVSQNEFTPPPKGGGAGYRLSWVGRVGSVRSKLGYAGSTGRLCCFAGVVLLPSHLTGHKSPHRAEFGFWACWLALPRRITSLSAIPYKNSGRRKKYLCPTFLKWTQLSPSSHASVSSNPVG